MADPSQWVGRREEHRDIIDPAPARLLAATLDLPSPEVGPGDDLPILWHWLYFLPDAPQSQLGPDGHPRRGGFFPPIDLRRRMFAGGSVAVHRPLRLGHSATLTREIAGIERKEGSSGPLVLVTVRVEIADGRGPAISEKQTIVYTDSTPAALHRDPVPVPGADWEHDVVADNVRLFRFSALTFNGHRIHYDERYAVEDEGYPNLVVHGPLTAMLLAEMARVRGIAGRTFRFRARAPLYVGEVIRLRGDETTGGVRLLAFGPSGRVAVEAQLSTNVAETNPA